MSKIISSRIRTLSFLMTCLMVLYHCPVAGESSACGIFDLCINDLLSGLIHDAGTLVMCFFFSVSGFLLFYKLSMANFSEKIKRRVSSLLIPYITWQILTALVVVIRDTVCGNEGKLFSFSTFLITTFCFVQWPYNGPLWYVYAIFFLALLSPAVLLAFRNKHTAQAAVLATFLLCFFITNTSNARVCSIRDYGYLGNIIRYLPCYMLGAYYGKFSKENVTVESLVFLILILLLGYAIDSRFAPRTSGANVLVLPLFLIYCVPIPNCFHNRSIYRRSFLMYALHSIVISEVSPVVKFVLHKITLPATLYTILMWCSILIVDIFLSYILHCVLERFAPKLLTILTGGRC